MIATAIFNIMPMTPIPSGDMPNSQFAARILAPRRPGPFEEQPLEELDVTVGEYQAREHTRDRAFLVDALEERYRAGSRETTRRPPARMRTRRPARPSQADRSPGSRRSRIANGGRDAARQQFSFLGDVRQEDAFDQVVRNGSRDHEQQSRRGRQGRSDSTGGDEGDDPVRQAGDLRIGEYHDVAIDRQLVALPAEPALGRARKSGFASS